MDDLHRNSHVTSPATLGHIRTRMDLRRGGPIKATVLHNGTKIARLRGPSQLHSHCTLAVPARPLGPTTKLATTTWVLQLTAQPCRSSPALVSFVALVRVSSAPAAAALPSFLSESASPRGFRGLANPTDQVRVWK